MPASISPVVQAALDANDCGHAYSDPANIQGIYDDIVGLRGVGGLVKFEGNQVVCYDPERSEGPILECPACLKMLRTLVESVFPPKLN